MTVAKYGERLSRATYLDFSRLSSALLKSGFWKGYPLEMSFAGSMRWLASRSSSAICPKASRAAKAGMGKIAGRDETDAKALVNSELVTGRGEVAFIGPGIVVDLS